MTNVPGLPARYAVEGPLGRGGQALTLAATDTGTGNPVVVKVFQLAGSEAWKRFELFERECKVLRSLEHSSIPRYFEHGGDEESGTFYLVMQRSPGESLQAMIDRGKRFTDAELESILEGLFVALDYLHSLNPPVIHRDLKPANVILDGSHVWLVDFGSVRDVIVDSRQSTVVGTYGYMAPEQLRGQSSPASDLYGLGATLAAAATGADAAKLPSRGLEVELSEVIKPGPFRDRLQWLLKANPDERPASVGAVRSGRSSKTTALTTSDGTAPVSAVARPTPEPRGVAVAKGRGLQRREARLAGGSGLSIGLLALIVSGNPVVGLFAAIAGVALGVPFARGFFHAYAPEDS